ncbi:ABC transporter permease [Streptomyces somaliensis DSM 40738]|uniref:Transport permease protein n=1 Tax=Streptomyces somaliensis (strain ATCC 33201 / DSM 40738 / JCM 12659 / KCTC 9044 / NCTC 11332 / NRRL B-12077 / IP 733) TaxID=1134445 RepID=A0AA44DBR9_STRE0|nr:ABC transporter permease [Streptomyces somaliensis]MCQ0024845.1 ABC transporter permease [Streptomyces somaliensis DSM 40738]NKY13729.1 ABC transporter permease [Streptomyces somaliensis DSM 40738]
MASTTVPDSPDTRTGTRTGTTAAGRLGALARAEMLLLVRNRTALFVTLLMPLLMIGSLRAALDGTALKGTGMSLVEAAVTGGLGMVLVIVVYLNLVPAYVSRREELVLKRLRTGEVSDAEVLTGTALPSVALALAQCVIMSVAAVAFLGVRAPQRPELLVAGVLVGIVLLGALAAFTATLTRTVESAQLTTMPLFLVSAFGSGLFIPLEALPERVEAACALLPVTGVVALVRAGWLGGADAGELVRAGAAALAWTAAALFAVRRRFRWEPRR